MALPSAAVASGPLCRGEPATIVGTAGPDVIYGTDGDDVIVALAGADVIYSGIGDDKVCAGLGNDTVVGGPGHDAIFGGGGADVISGSGGADHLVGNEGGDSLHGGAGPDLLEGGPGSDVLRGDFGNDTLHGGPEPDQIRGGPGRDTVRGGSGSDVVRGGPGNDVLKGTSGPDTVLGGPGNDELHGGLDADDCAGGFGSDTVAACELLSDSSTVDMAVREVWEAAPARPGLIDHDIDKVTIHHAGTATGTVGPAQFRRWQDHHLSLGWPDIAYHFIIGRDSVVYEARPWTKAGDTATSYDPNGHLLLVVEGFFEEDVPTAGQIESLAMMLAWGAQHFDVPVEEVMGHRDHAPTLCPGAHLYAHIVDGSLADRARQIIEEGGVTLVVG